ncbi:MAG: stage II sporulation protein M [Eubacteriales bacterium]
MNKGDLTKFILRNRRIFLLLSTMFVIGIILGTLCVKGLSDIQKTELMDYLSNFFKVLSNTDNELNNNEMFFQLLFDNLKIYGLLMLFGLITIGMVGIPALVVIKGFILGFTIGFILDELYLMGFLFSLFVIFPQNILYIIGLIFSSSMGIMMSHEKYSSKRKYRMRGNGKRGLQQIGSYAIVILISYIITALGCAFEAYITPIFMIFFSNKLF